MSNTSPTNQDALRHDAPAAAARQAQPGAHLWAIRKDGRQLVCELRDHGTYGVEVQLLGPWAFYFDHVGTFPVYDVEVRVEDRTAAAPGLTSFCTMTVVTLARAGGSPFARSAPQCLQRIAAS